MYDIIVVGAGPAGLTAAIYAGRADKKVLLVEKEVFGGQITFSPKIENYPGFAQISGNELADKFLEQVNALGVDIEFGEVREIVRQEDGTFIVRIDENDFLGRTVILATGAKHRPLGVEKEENFIGKGISYCAVCDGAFYEGKEVAVIGGGNSALVEAVMLSDLCKKVTIVQNLAFLTGEEKQIKTLTSRPNVDIIYNVVVDSIMGDREFEGLILKNDKGEKIRLSVDGVFVAIGQIPVNDIFADFVQLNDRGYIVAGEDCATVTPGVFVAGDCRTKGIRQITTACADGATAAVAACRYLEA